MANISFGSSSDPSAIFASLNRQYLSDQDALARNADSRANERRDAEDANMFDKWKNGLISDDAWLAYISQRVEESAGDPKEHEQWVELQREYTTSIADQKAEFRYNNGEITIHDLIAYYRTRRDGVNKDSQEWRELTTRLNSFVDKAAAEDITLGAQDLADRIALGQASLSDLRAYYAAKLKGLRPNSDLYEKVQAEIRDIDSQIRTGGVSVGGGGGGRSYGGGGGTGGYSSAEEYGIATASGFLQQDSDLMAQARDARGVSRAARSFSGFIPGLSESETDDYLEAQSLFYEGILKAWANGDTAYDGDGNAIPDDGHTRRQVSLAYLDTMEQRHTALTTGDRQDLSKAQGIENSMRNAITKYVQPANGLIYQTEVLPTILTVIERNLGEILDNNDYARLPAFIDSSTKLLGKSLEVELTNQTRFLEGADTPIQGRKRGTWKPAWKGMTPEDIGYVNNIIGAITAAGTGDTAALDDLFKAIGPSPLTEDTGLLPTILAANQDANALANHEAVLVYDGRAHLRNPRGSGLVMKPAKEVGTYDPATGAVQSDWVPDERSLGPNESLQTIFIDTPTGITQVRAIARTVRVGGLSTVFGTASFMDGKYNGKLIPAGVLSPSDIQNQLKAGNVRPATDAELASIPAFNQTSVEYVRNGHLVTMWYSPVTGAWGSKRVMPVGVTGPYVLLDENQQIPGHYEPFVQGKQVPLIYAGKNRQRFQAMIDNGEIPKELLMMGEVGPDGMPTGNLVYGGDAYYSNFGLKTGASWVDPDVQKARKDLFRRTHEGRSGFRQGADTPFRNKGTNPTDPMGTRNNPEHTEFDQGGPTQMTVINDVMAGLGIFGSVLGSVFGPHEPTIWNPLRRTEGDVSTGILGDLRAPRGPSEAISSAAARMRGERQAALDQRAAAANRALNELPRVQLPRPASPAPLQRASPTLPKYDGGYKVPTPPPTQTSKSTSTTPKKRTAYKLPSRY